MIEVSIVIVCMNNLDNLYPCLKSIQKYTMLDYETFVVAYLFSRENLNKIKSDYPWVTLIESNVIRGFSENNNLALRQAKGKYCLVLNDDTEIISSAIEKLVETIESLPERVAVVSPLLYLYDGTIQFCGRPPITMVNYILSLFKLWDERKTKSQYINKDGVFKTYNITGAAFLIKRSVFEEVGWFDERFFFTPEDIALSTKLNKLGYECYVNTNAKLIHYEGKTRKSSMSYASIKPASLRGNLIYYANGSLFIYVLLIIIQVFRLPPLILYHYFKGFNKEKPNTHYALMVGYINCLYTCFTTKSAKEIFIKFYEKNR